MRARSVVPVPFGGVCRRAGARYWHLCAATHVLGDAQRAHAAQIPKEPGPNARLTTPQVFDKGDSCEPTRTVQPRLFKAAHPRALDFWTGGDAGLKIQHRVAEFP
jgi:hypothetical protein